MRKVTAGLFHSLDGVVEAPNEWQFDSFDDELGASMGAFISRTDAVILGRVGYEEWSQYWPSMGTQDFGGFINPIRKYVASTTLTGDLHWENSTLVEGDLFDFVRQLKETEGGEIAVCGGISIVRSLFFAGLIDTLTVMTHPVVASTGSHLFEPGDPVTRLAVQSTTVTSKGNVIVDYGLRG